MSSKHTKSTSRVSSAGGGGPNTQSSQQATSAPNRKISTSVMQSAPSSSAKLKSAQPGAGTTAGTTAGLPPLPAKQQQSAIPRTSASQQVPPARPNIKPPSSTAYRTPTYTSTSYPKNVPSATKPQLAKTPPPTPAAPSPRKTVLSEPHYAASGGWVQERIPVPDDAPEVLSFESSTNRISVQEAASSPRTSSNATNGGGCGGQQQQTSLELTEKLFSINDGLRKPMSMLGGGTCKPTSSGIVEEHVAGDSGLDGQQRATPTPTSNIEDSPMQDDQNILSASSLTTSEPPPTPAGRPKLPDDVASQDSPRARTENPKIVFHPLRVPVPMSGGPFSKEDSNIWAARPPTPPTRSGKVVKEATLIERGRKGGMRGMAQKERIEPGPAEVEKGGEDTSVSEANMPRGGGYFEGVETTGSKTRDEIQTQAASYPPPTTTSTASVVSTNINSDAPSQTGRQRTRTAEEGLGDDYEVLTGSPTRPYRERVESGGGVLVEGIPENDSSEVPTQASAVSASSPSAPTLSATPPAVSHSRDASDVEKNQQQARMSSSAPMYRRPPATTVTQDTPTSASLTGQQAQQSPRMTTSGLGQRRQSGQDTRMQQQQQEFGGRRRRRRGRGEESSGRLEKIESLLDMLQSSGRLGASGRGQRQPGVSRVSKSQGGRSMEDILHERLLRLERLAGLGGGEEETGGIELEYMEFVGGPMQEEEEEASSSESSVSSSDLEEMQRGGRGKGMGSKRKGGRGMMGMGEQQQPMMGTRGMQRQEQEQQFEGRGRKQQSKGVWPLVNVYELDSEVLITADLPGCSESGITVEISGPGNAVLLSGCVSKELSPGMEAQGISTIGEAGGAAGGEQQGGMSGKVKRVVLKERKMDSFERKVKLPVRVDPTKARAKVQDGVLELRIGKHAGSRVPIGLGSSQQQQQQQQQ
ncbi:hypothetical protein HDV05_006237 [Chytridiales sp. JEL 0842]|nr:hypothetical protein HDV05_006237 [Chytridiales sp. JEL 0842]